MDEQDDSSHALPQVESTSGGPVEPSSTGTSSVSGQGHGIPATVPTASPTPGTQIIADDDTPHEAGDVDLIEKAWVEKAKSIVDSTQGDPYKQNERLSKVKSDYLKKRYNRDIEPKG